MNAWMKRFSALLPAAAMVLTAALGPGPLSGQETQEEVVRLRFTGNRHFRSEALENAILTRETSCRSFILLPFCWAGAEFSKEPNLLIPREFRRDLQRLRLFYYQRGYRQTVVDTTVDRSTRGEVAVTFQIQEGDPVRVAGLEFAGLAGLSDPAVGEGLPLEEGDPLNALVLEATRDTLMTRLRDRGFAHADVLLNYNIPAENPLEAAVVFDLYSGPPTFLGPLSVVGNTTVPETVVRRMLPFREGDPYSQELLFDGQRNLYNLDIFSFASIVPNLTNVPDSIVPLLVQVTEGDTHRVRAGAGLSSADCVNTEARWASRNFMGGARRLQFTGRVANILAPIFESTLCRESGTGEYGELTWSVSADFNQPWLLSPRNSLSMSLFGERQSLPDVFVREGLGLNLGITHLLTPTTAATFSLRPQISSLDAAEIFFCSNYLVCAPRDIRVLQRANWLSPVGVRFSQDRRNQALSPTRGHALVLDLEHADDWSGSDFRYTRLVGEASWYTQTRSRWVFAARLRGGVVAEGGFRGLVQNQGSAEIIHPEKRFYAGGSNSVRGFAQNRLGPQVLNVLKVENLLRPRNGQEVGVCTPQEVMNLTCDAAALPDQEIIPRPTGGTSLLEGSLEARFPISGQIWEGATFLDFGQVWEDPGDFDPGDLEFTPGFGVRFLSPIGPIRVDVGYRFDQGDRLRVVTPQIRPFDPNQDDPQDRILVDGEFVDFLESDELALLGPRVAWGKLDTWSLERFQLHLSIGQAF